jgi:hypothetical protein
MESYFMAKVQQLRRIVIPKLIADALNIEREDSADARGGGSTVRVGRRWSLLRDSSFTYLLHIAHTYGIELKAFLRCLHEAGTKGAATHGNLAIQCRTWDVDHGTFLIRWTGASIAQVRLTARVWRQIWRLRDADFALLQKTCKRRVEGAKTEGRAR